MICIYSNLIFIISNFRKRVHEKLHLSSKFSKMAFIFHLSSFRKTRKDIYKYALNFIVNRDSKPQNITKVCKKFKLIYIVFNGPS